MKFKATLRWMNNYFEEAVCVITLIALSLVMLLQIVVRYLFKNPLPWPEEFSRYAFIYACMFGMGYCIRQGKMLRIDLLIQKLPHKLGALLDMTGTLLSLVFYSIMLSASWQVTMKSYSIMQLSPAMQIPMWLIYIAGPLGFLMAIFRSLQSIALIIKSFKKGPATENGGNA